MTKEILKKVLIKAGLVLIIICVCVGYYFFLTRNDYKEIEPRDYVESNNWRVEPEIDAKWCEYIKDGKLVNHEYYKLLKLKNKLSTVKQNLGSEEEAAEIKRRGCNQ